MKTEALDHEVGAVFTLAAVLDGAPREKPTKCEFVGQFSFASGAFSS